MLAFKIEVLSIMINKEKYFKEEVLSESDLVKVVMSLQDQLLRQQYLLADAYAKCEKAQKENSRLIFNSEFEVANIKDEQMQEYSKVQSEHNDFMNSYQKQLKSLRSKL